MATIRDVAKMAGVSISTVSLAFSAKGRVSPDTHQRIWAAAQTVGYVPNPLAQGLKSGRSRLIGMVVGDISNPFFGRLLKGVERTALAHNHMVIVSDSDADAKQELAIIDQLTEQRVAGIILSPHGNAPDYVERIKGLKMPLVMVDHRVPSVEADFVGSDNVLASAMLTEHMIRYGHRRIAHIAGRAGLYTTSQRLKGFLETMQGAGIEVDQSLVADGDYRGERAYAEAMRLMTRADRPTAILAANNVMALGALQAINDLGFICPTDISLTSIDDVPWGNVIQPRITMVVQQVDELARIASEWLLERIRARGGDAIPPREHILMPQLVVGQSCAAPSTQ
ncbi:MAG: LacI family DNA-binding transcriptional regulator [Devosia sp.]